MNNPLLLRTFFVCFAAFSTLQANAATITIDSTITGRTTGSSGDILLLEAYRSDTTTRHGIAEFNISSIPANATINSITLEITQKFSISNGNSDVEVLGYLGNGLFDVSGDFNAGIGNVLLAAGSLTAPNGTPADTQSNVAMSTSYIQSLVTNSDQFIGLEFLQEGTITENSVGIVYYGTEVLQSPKLHIDFTAVPIPASAWLFGSGLLGLVGIARRKKA